ncbi:hypothetical protein RSAG8_01989, partial [Rhizoctonia solani AG-8 WAC10335]
MALTRSVAMDLGLSQSTLGVGTGSGKSASASDIAALGKARTVVDAHLAKHASRIPPLDETINASASTDYTLVPIRRSRSCPHLSPTTPSVRSPDSPRNGPSRASTLDGEFSIIPYHPSMSASHPAPAVHNNPAYAPTGNDALVRTTWTSSPTQGPSMPHRVQIDRETASLAQKYSRFAISSLNYMDIEAAKKELKAALTLLESGDMY